MRVVGNLELVFHNHDLSCRLVMSEEIQREPADWMFCPLKDEVHAQKVRQYIDVVQEPRCKIQRLVCPDFSRKNWFESSELKCHLRSVPRL